MLVITVLLHYSWQRGQDWLNSIKSFCVCLCFDFSGHLSSSKCLGKQRFKNVSYLQAYELPHVRREELWASPRWKQTPAGRQQTLDIRLPFRLCRSVRLILASSRPPLGHSPASLRLPRWELAVPSAGFCPITPAWDVSGFPSSLWNHETFFILNLIQFYSPKPRYNNRTWLQSCYSCVSSQSKLLPAIICTTTLPFLLVV